MAHRGRLALLERKLMLIQAHRVRQVLQDMLGRKRRATKDLQGLQGLQDQ
jgi:hypothetical protein